MVQLKLYIRSKKKMRNYVYFGFKHLKLQIPNCVKMRQNFDNFLVFLCVACLIQIWATQLILLLSCFIMFVQFLCCLFGYGIPSLRLFQCKQNFIESGSIEMHHNLTMLFKRNRMEWNKQQCHEAHTGLYNSFSSFSPSVFNSFHWNFRLYSLSRESYNKNNGKKY